MVGVTFALLRHNPGVLLHSVNLAGQPGEGGIICSQTQLCAVYLLQVRHAALERAQRLSSPLIGINNRDLRTLELAGVPLFGEAGVGYSLAEGYRLPPVMFTREEATALLTAEKLAAQLTDAPTAQLSGAAMDKLRAVLRHADRMGFAEIEKTIADFGRRARDGKLSIDEMQGGTFTISNGGVYGSLMSTPILNAPQSGILGMHKIQDRPMVVGGKIEIRPMMYLALSYDHRIVDGKEAVTFLVRVKESLEDPARLLFDI